MRRKLFFVVYPPDNIQKEIDNKIALLKRSFNLDKSLVWSTAEKHNISLIYLGAVSNEAKQAAIEGAESILPETFSFELSLGFTSYFFKDEKGPGSLIFLSIQDKEKYLRNLHKGLSVALRERGFSPSTHYTPNIPIARLRRQRFEHDQMRILDDLTQVELPVGEAFTINQFELVESLSNDVLSAKHSVLKTFPFNK